MDDIDNLQITTGSTNLDETTCVWSLIKHSKLEKPQVTLPSSVLTLTCETIVYIPKSCE
jgi:hypothetical protein